MRAAKAHAKLNLALVVGSLRADGKHEVETVMQALDLHDELVLEPAAELVVEGYPEDSLVRAALRALGEAAGVAPRWRVTIEKRIPVAAGLGGGSSDAAAALRLANETLAAPLALDALHDLASRLGADVPFFLRDGPQLATGDGTVLEPLALPRDYSVLLVLPHGSRKESTASVYAELDRRGGADGFDDRRSALRAALARARGARDLGALPPNDLCSSPLADDLVSHGAFRADVTGAGPTVYGLFEHAEDARRAAVVFGDAGETWLTHPLAPG
jgi:4-diphosphocytidyl-2-C-methyl-D-erythritol kinase